MNGSDKTIAALITDGCNMGVKSLSRYLNQYKAASETAKDIAKRLINLEERLVVDLRVFVVSMWRYISQQRANKSLILKICSPLL